MRNLAMNTCRCRSATFLRQYNRNSSFAKRIFYNGLRKGKRSPIDNWLFSVALQWKSSFVFAMWHAFSVQFLGDAYPGRRALSARLAPGWYVLRLQRFCRLAAAWCRLQGHVTLRATSPQHSRKTAALGSAERPGNRRSSTLFTLSMGDHLFSPCVAASLSLYCRPGVR